MFIKKKHLENFPGFCPIGNFSDLQYFPVIYQKRVRQPCSEGHTKGPVWIPQSSVHVGTRVPQWRDERVLQGDLQPREPLD